MIDVHYHLLFGLDDGPGTLEDSLELAHASIAEGVTHIVATPHANYRYRFNPELNRERLALLQEKVGDQLTLGLGCDFHLSYDNIADLEQHPTKYTINGKQYLLVEFPDFGIPPSIGEALCHMGLLGIVPVITHPERNPTLQAEPQRMAAWIHDGCLVQITGDSLGGRFGQRAQKLALSLVKQNWVHLVASDAHSVKGRPPSMKRAYTVLEEQFGRDVADRLCIENPRAIFYGEPLNDQPEPKGIFDMRQLGGGFWSRLLQGAIGRR